MNGHGDSSGTSEKAAYEAPTLERLGLFHVETRDGCFWGKQLGGYDGIHFMGMGISVSACS